MGVAGGGSWQGSTEVKLLTLTWDKVSCKVGEVWTRPSRKNVKCALAFWRWVPLYLAKALWLIHPFASQHSVLGRGSPLSPASHCKSSVDVSVIKFLFSSISGGVEREERARESEEENAHIRIGALGFFFCLFFSARSLSTLLSGVKWEAWSICTFEPGCQLCTLLSVNNRRIYKIFMRPTTSLAIASAMLFPRENDTCKNPVTFQIAFKSHIADNRL